MDVQTSITDFTRKFDAEYAEIASLADQGTNKPEVLTRLATLEKAVSDAQLFLPAYDVRRCIQMIGDLNSKLVLDKNKSRPKFSFSSKAKKSNVQSKPEESPQVPNADVILETAPKRQEFAPPPSATVYTNLSNTLLRPKIANNASEVYLSNITCCIVDLRVITPTGAVHIKNVSNCIILCGGIKGSVLIDGMKDSVLVAACRQFRMHNSTTSRILLHVSSNPIIEDCNQLVIGPYTSTTVIDQKTDSNAIAENGCAGRWGKVDDFNWLRSTESPHWRKV
ncbi:tubulin binding cofactor C-domain-containing protein, partial [Obelidium mucronatum]